MSPGIHTAHNSLGGLKACAGIQAAQKYLKMSVLVDCYQSVAVVMFIDETLYDDVFLKKYLLVQHRIITSMTVPLKFFYLHRVYLIKENNV